MSLGYLGNIDTLCFKKQKLKRKKEMQWEREKEERAILTIFKNWWKKWWRLHHTRIPEKTHMEAREVVNMWTSVKSFQLGNGKWGILSEDSLDIKL